MITSSSSRSFRSGFSLAEVTMAVGITALGILVLLGLLPQGLNMAREGGNAMSELRIIQQILGETQLTEWSTLVDGGVADSSSNRCFDDQAVEIPRGSSDLARRLAYVAKVEVKAPDVRMPGEASASTSAASTGGSSEIRKFVIKIASSTDPNFSFDSARQVLVRTHTCLVSRTTPETGTR